MTPSQADPTGTGGMPRRAFLTIGGAVAGATILGSSPAWPATTTRPGPLDDDGTFAESVVWGSGEDGRITHFVYGLAVTTRETVLAFSEARISKADDGAHDLVLKRSTDGGASWGDTIVIEASDGEQCWSNPAALVDQRTGTALIFYVLNTDNAATQLYVRSSVDDGRTWSPRIELTGLFDGNPQEWTVHMPGPGHGIQLRDGRLLLQVWHRRTVTLPADQRRYGVSVLISDDHGRTWRNGGTIPVDPVYPVNESRLVERTDGSIVMNGRYSSSGVHPRITAVSRDRGESWSAPVSDSAVALYTAVDSSFTRYSGLPGTSRTLFSRPDSTTARENLVVGVSYDDGCSFPYQRTVYSGASSYSDIAHLSDGTILVLYGKDLATGNVVDHVALARFDLSWLTQGRDSLRQGPQLREERHQGESLRVLGSGESAGVVSGPNASGYRLLEHLATASGGYVDLALVLPHRGTFDLIMRCRQTTDSGVTQVLLDGQPVGTPFTPVLAAGTGFAEFRCGPVTISNPGQHVLRCLTTAADGGGLRFDLDYVRLTVVDPVT